MLRCFTVALAGLLCACDYNDADEGSLLPVSPYASVAPVGKPSATSTVTSPPAKPEASEEELVEHPGGHGTARDSGTELADAAPSTGHAADGSVAEDAGSKPSHPGHDASSDSPSSDSPSSDSPSSDLEATDTATAGEDTESEPAESDVGVGAGGELDAGTSFESPDDEPEPSLDASVGRDASAQPSFDSGPASDSGSVSPEASLLGVDAAL